MGNFTNEEVLEEVSHVGTSPRALASPNTWRVRTWTVRELESNFGVRCMGEG